MNALYGCWHHGICRYVPRSDDISGVLSYGRVGRWIILGSLVHILGLQDEEHNVVGSATCHTGGQLQQD